MITVDPQTSPQTAAIGAASTGRDSGLLYLSGTARASPHDASLSPLRAIGNAQHRN